MAGRDITEGRSGRAIAIDIGLNTTTIWQNTNNTYDFAIAGIPFIAAIRDDRPYDRSTAPFRKQRNSSNSRFSGWLMDWNSSNKFNNNIWGKRIICSI